MFLDEDGIMPVQGLMTSSYMSASERQPIVMPKYHYYSGVLVLQVRQQVLQARARGMSVQLQEAY